MLWQRVSASRPCEICGKPDWCRYKDDVVHCCRATVAPPGRRLIKLAKSDGAIFRRTEAVSPKVLERSDRPGPKQDWESLQLQLARDLQVERRDELAAQLGVSSQSLVAIGCGWLASERCWTFPERNARGEIVGIIKRNRNGAKIALRSSIRGLTIPDDLPSEGFVLSPEGASDTAALLTMGLAAEGRFSARGGAEDLAELCKTHELLVLGELDEKGDGSCPGRDGARAVAQKVANAWGKPVKVVMPPEGAKDVRAWLTSRNIDLSDSEACTALGREFLDKVLASAETVHPDTDRGLHYDVDQHARKPKSCIKVSQCSKVVAVETLDLSSSRSRKQCARSIAAKIEGADSEHIEEDLLNLAVEQSSIPQPADDYQRTYEELVADRDAQAASELATMPADVVSNAKAMLSNPMLVDQIAADIKLVGVVGERELALTLYLVGVSRLLERPLGAVVQGTSSSGKSYTIGQVAKLFPPEVLLAATDITPTAMYYLPPDSLVHRWVVAGERRRGKDVDEHADATRALREMLSAGQLSKAIPFKHNGRLETVLLQRHGPIAFTESSTQVRIFDEDANRCLLLGTDESPTQTRQVVLAEAASRACVTNVSRKEVVLRHFALQRLLRRVHVVIPFATQLAKRMPAERPEARRAFGHALDLIQTITLLFQRQRVQVEVGHGTSICATLADYDIARTLLVGPLGRALGGDLPDAVLRFGGRIFNLFGTDILTALKASRRDPVVKSKSKAIEYFRALAEAGFAELVEPGRGSAPHLWRMIGLPSERGARWLPSCEELGDGNDPHAENRNAS